MRAPMRKVWSRFVTVEIEGRAMKAMAPVFDMFNHDPSSSTVHGFQESNQVRPLSREAAVLGLYRR